jgi:hypothetical protein
VKGQDLDCPTYGREETLTTATPGQFSEVNLSVSGPLGLQIFMLASTEPTDVVVSVEGRNPNNADLGQWRIVAIVYLTAVIVLLIFLFVHAILARGRVHYKVDLSVNE